MVHKRDPGGSGGGSNPTPITTNHSTSLKYFIETTLKLPHDSFADLAVWSFTGGLSTTTFKEFILHSKFDTIVFDEAIANHACNRAMQQSHDTNLAVCNF